MKNSSRLVLLIVGLWLTAIPAISSATNPTGGRDFDIVHVSLKGAIVNVEICCRSQKGMDSPVMILCKTGRRETLKKSIYFKSGDCKTIHFNIPKTLPQKIFVSVNAEDVGKFGVGWWQFDSWEGELNSKK